MSISPAKKSLISKPFHILRKIREDSLRLLSILAPSRMQLPFFGIPSGCRNDAPPVETLYPAARRSFVSGSDNIDPRIRKDLDRELVCREAWIAEIVNGTSSSFGDLMDQKYRLCPTLSFRYIGPAPKCRDEQSIGHGPFRIGLDKIGSRVWQEDGTVVSLTASPRYSGNYFHWLFDILPRIGLAQTLEKGPFRIYTNQRFGFQVDSLALLGFDENFIISAEDYPFCKAKKLVVPSFPDAFCGIPDWVNDFHEEHLIPVVKQVADRDRVHFGNRLYIGRENAATRRVVNQLPVLSLMKDHGFESLDPATLSFLNQALVFFSCDTIVAIHGAALSNLVFCRPGTRVLEIFPPGYVFPLYRDLSVVRGLDYFALSAANPVELGDGDKFQNQHLDFYLDPGELSTCLKKIL